MIAWVVVLVASVWWIGGEMAFGSTTCVRAIDNGSTQLHRVAIVSWIPPARVWHYDNGVIAQPSDARTGLVIGLAVTPPFVVVALRRRRALQAPAALVGSA